MKAPNKLILECIEFFFTYEGAKNMRALKIASILLLLAVLALAAAPKTATEAASTGAITDVCRNGDSLIVTVNALGDEDDSGGYDEIGAVLYLQSYNYYVIQFGPIPADNQFHTLAFLFDVSGVDPSAEAHICAGNGDGSGHTTDTEFDGCSFYADIPACAPFAGPPGPSIPAGFELHTITCSTAVYGLPGGQPVGANAVLAGQTWYVNPVPVAGPDGEDWTEIFLSGPVNAYIPAVCVN